MSTHTPDPFQLARFIEAQEEYHETALKELRAGEKRSHWMWFVFPQVAGLGSSFMAQRYAIGSRLEAEAYLIHPILGLRLTACAGALLEVQDRSAEQIMGVPDFQKLQSCMTLFAAISSPGSVFERVLEKYYGGEKDGRTIRFLSRVEPGIA